MAGTSVGQVKLVLQLKICSARKLSSPMNVFVSIGFGTWSRQTSVKKHTDKPIWNETFILPVDDASQVPGLVVRLMQKDLLGKIHERGQAEIALPVKTNELLDTWVKLDVTADLHLCMQLEPLAGRSLDSVLGRQSARGSLLRFGGSSMRLLGTLTSSFQAGELGDGRTPKETGSSNFAVKAGAVTLNEICQSLDRLRGIIYLSGAEINRNPDERVGQLQRAKVELDELEDQVDTIDGLSEEWKEKLAALIEDYARDCWKMLSDESWERLTQKRQSTRVPPPLPPKATMDKIRKDRLSMVVNTEASHTSSSSKSVGQGEVNNREGGPQRKVAVVQERQHVVVVKEHYLASLGAFDALMDVGFCVEFRGSMPVKPKKTAITGDIASFVMTSFVYDAIICKVVSYDGPKQQSLAIGSQHPDIPKGLEAALCTLSSGTSYCVVTVATEWAFGDDGHENGVPPNSTLVFVIEHFTFSPNSLNEEEDLADFSTSSKSSMSVLAKEYGTFPAREAQVVLDLPVSPLVGASVVSKSPLYPTGADPSQSNVEMVAKVGPGSAHPGLMSELNARLSRRTSQL